MAFAAVQSTTMTVSTASSVPTTVSATGSLNLVIVHVKVAGGETLSSVTDDKSNTYAIVGPKIWNTTDRVYQAYGVQTTGGATTVTCTFSASTTGKRVVITEFSGNATTNATAYDKDSNGSGTGTAASVTSFTPTNNGELISATLAYLNNFSLKL